MSDSGDTDEPAPPPAQTVEVEAEPGEIQVEVFGRTDVGLVREHNEKAGMKKASS